MTTENKKHRVVICVKGQEKITYIEGDYSVDFTIDTDAEATIIKFSEDSREAVLDWIDKTKEAIAGEEKRIISL